MYSMSKKPSPKKSVDKKMPAAAGMSKTPPMMLRGARTATNKMTKAKRGK